MLWTLPPLFDVAIFGTNQRAVPDSRPTTSGSGHLLVGTWAADTLYSVEPSTGAIRWWHESDFGSMAELLIDGSDIVVNYFFGQVEVLNLETGAVRWRTESREVYYWPAVTESLLVYSSPTGPRAFRR
jgi:outer membrane protein assembly factor BamB